LRSIHQFVPMLHRGDAVGRHTLRLRDLMVARGIDSQIYVELVDPQTAAETALVSRYPTERQAGDILLYQFATASDLAPWLVGRSETVVVNYHNITPPELFAAWDNRLAQHQVRAQAELRLLAPRTALAVAVSSYNRRDLEAAGYATTAVVPPAALLPPPAVLPTETRPGAAVGSDRRTGPSGRGARWLSVGRMAPNKGIEDALMALLVVRSTQDAEATLEIVGKPVVASYTNALHRFIADMGLGEAVVFRGSVSDDELARAYARADVLVVTSAHEGFGVPLMEAMSVGLPLVVSSKGALPEVVGEAGVVVDTRDPWALAAAVSDLLNDAARRAALVALGRKQLTTLDLDTAGDRLIDLVCELN